MPETTTDVLTALLTNDHVRAHLTDREPDLLDRAVDALRAAGVDADALLDDARTRVRGAQQAAAIAALRGYLQVGDALIGRVFSEPNAIPYGCRFTVRPLTRRYSAGLGYDGERQLTLLIARACGLDHPNTINVDAPVGDLDDFGPPAETIEGVLEVMRDWTALVGEAVYRDPHAFAFVPEAQDHYAIAHD